MNATSEIYYDIVSTHVISIISFGISILFLCSHLIVYSITEEMWTLTGNSLASFCISLLLSHCSYIAGMVVEHQNTTCSIIAILNYYFFLTNATWLLTISMIVFQSSKQTISQREHESKNSCRFVSYSIFSWILPALMLGVSMYLESQDILNMPKSFQVDLFPKGSYCFNKNTALLLWFLIFFNINLILTFLLSAFTCFGTCSKYRDLQNEEFLGKLKFYVKLSILVGCVWILGMCMIYFKSGLLYMAFALANGILGLYIFLVFTFNNKLSNMVFYEDKSYNLEIIRGDKHLAQIDSSSTVLRPPITSDV